VARLVPVPASQRRLSACLTPGGIIRPDQFEEFPLSVRVPDGTPGDELVFKAIQTYRGGEKVRWTGAPDAETPAPRVTLTAPAATTAGGA
jgi:hypothetical protein